MSERSNLILLAAYNRWMNEKLYAAAAQLSAHALCEERGAFFGSVMGTLNHIVAGDTIWLQRFAVQCPAHGALDPVRALAAPSALAAVFSTDLAALQAHRVMLDAVIVRWIDGMAEAELETTLHYRNSKGIAGAKRLGSVLLHFFNHQTHHRGQVTTLLSQAGVDVGVTDLLMLVPNAG